MAGWVKIDRDVEKHWIWKNSDYFQAWITIIFTVNFEDKKVLIHGELIDCKRGQSLLSLSNWAEKFGKNWTIQRVRTFVNLLKMDNMIMIEGLRKTTRLTVCNYDAYQDQQQTNNTQVTNKQHTSNTQVTTTKEREERKEFKKIEEREKSFYDLLTPHVSEFGKDMIRNFFNYWSEHDKDNKKMRFELQKTFEIKKRLSTWSAKEFNKTNTNGNNTNQISEQATGRKRRII